MGDELVSSYGLRRHQWCDGELCRRLGSEQQWTFDLLSVVGSNSGVSSVLTNALVKLGLNTQELLEVVPSQVQVGDETTNKVGTDLISGHI